MPGFQWECVRQSGHIDPGTSLHKLPGQITSPRLGNEEEEETKYAHDLNSTLRFDKREPPTVELHRLMKYELRKTGDGSLTVYHPGVGESFKSGHAARTEAEWVFLRPAVLEHPHLHQESPFRVLELGFGLGTNFQFLVDWHKLHAFRSLEFTSIDRDLTGAAYLAGQGGAATETVALLEGRTWKCEGLIARLLESTFETELAKFPDHHFHAVFFDPFSPKAEPESWALPIFQEVARVVKPGARLATYSVSRTAKDGLSQSGFQWTKTSLPEALHKRNGMLAIRL